MSGQQKNKQKTRKKKAKFGKAQAAPRRAPVAISRNVTTSAPTFKRRKDSVVISHREYFLSVSTLGVAGSFEVTSLQVNPGNPSLFPWLSSQSFGWERYRFNRLSVEYVPRCATTQAGSLILSPDYDAADEPPATEPMACSYADATSSAAWTPVTLRLRKEPMMGGATSKFVRVGALKENLDIKTYDCATLHVCREGAGPNQLWGKLWVDYEVELLTPHTIPTPWTSTYASASQTTPQPSNAPFFGTTTPGAVVEKAGPISISSSNPTVATNLLNIDGLIPGAQYLFQFIAEAAAATTAISSLVPGLTGLTVLNILTGANTWTPPGAGSKAVMYEFLAQAASAAATFAISCTGATIRGGQLIVSPVTPDPAWSLL